MISSDKPRALVKRYRRASRFVRLIVLPHPTFTIPQSPPKERHAYLFTPTPSLFKEPSRFSRSTSWQSIERSSVGTSRSRRFLSPDDTWDLRTPKRGLVPADPRRQKYGALGVRASLPPSPSPSERRKAMQKNNGDSNPSVRVRTLSEPTKVSPSVIDVKDDKPRSVSQPVPRATTRRSQEGLGMSMMAKLLTPILEDAPTFSAMYPSFGSSLSALQSSTALQTHAEAKPQDVLRSPPDISLASDDAVENMSSYIGSLPSVMLTAASPVLTETSNEEPGLNSRISVFSPPPLQRASSVHGTIPDNHSRRASSSSYRRTASAEFQQRRRSTGTQDRASTPRSHRRRSSSASDETACFVAQPRIPSSTHSVGHLAPSTPTPKAGRSRRSSDSHGTVYYTPGAQSPTRRIASETTPRRTSGTFEGFARGPSVNDASLNNPTRFPGPNPVSRILPSPVSHSPSSPTRRVPPSPIRYTSSSSRVTASTHRAPHQTHSRRSSYESALSVTDSMALTHAVLGLLAVEEPAAQNLGSLGRPLQVPRTPERMPRTPESIFDAHTSEIVHRTSVDVYRTPDGTPFGHSTAVWTQSKAPRTTPSHLTDVKLSTLVIDPFVDMASPTSEETAVESVDTRRKHAWTRRVVEKFTRAVQRYNRQVRNEKNR